MRRVLAWVVGEGGLLGSRMRRRLPEEIPGCDVWRRPESRIPWERSDETSARLKEEAGVFLAAAARGHDRWAVFWCAGAGTVQTSDTALAVETRVFERFLEDLGRAGDAAGLPGALLLASSAGAVYGESADGALTEDSPCRPISAYGRQKLRHEELVFKWGESHPWAGWLIARFSTLYGTGQNLSKPQGLISQLVRYLLLRIPLNVYVSLDTQRDFLHASDAARQAARCMGRLLEADAPRREIKLMISGRSVCLGEVSALLKRVTRLPVRILGGPDAAKSRHPAKHRLRSVKMVDVPTGPSTALAAGVHEIYREQLFLLERGLLPPPRRA